MTVLATAAEFFRLGVFLLCLVLLVVGGCLTLVAIGAYWRMFVCGLHGHCIMAHREPDKLSLRCEWCGYQSNGWTIGKGRI